MKTAMQKKHTIMIKTENAFEYSAKSVMFHPNAKFSIENPVKLESIINW